MDEYLLVNRANWDERAPAHFTSPGYEVDRFVADPEFVSAVVRFDRERLGSLSGAEALHLQCHIGTDTISLARLGARVTGVDLSPVSIDHARRLAEMTGTPARFVVSDVYSAPSVLPKRAFDLVYTGVGALCWLPDIAQWATVVATMLAPGGRLFMREGHPMLWAVDETHADRVQVDYPYFETPEPLVLEDNGTYVETDVAFDVTRTYTWNHGLGEIVTALLAEGLELTGLREHDSVPWNALPGQMTRDAEGEWRLSERPERLAASYTLQAVRPA